MSAEGRLIRETARLRIRELVLGDVAFILELLNDPGWIRFIGDRNVRSDDDARGYLERGPLASYAANGFGLYAVCLREGDPRPVGMVGLVKRESLPVPDLGFAFLPGARGLGYTREAGAAILEQARDELHLPRLLAITTPDNERSMRALEALGFVLEKKERVTASDDGEAAEKLCVFARVL